jgi:hypothetical protein
MSTPFGKRGHFWETWEAGAFNRVKVPATEVPRISPEFLAEEKRSMPLWWYLQEYMCEFQESVDQVFGYEYVMAALSDDFEPFFGGKL